MTKYKFLNDQYQHYFTHARFLLSSEIEHKEYEIEPTLSEIFNHILCVLNVSPSQKNIYVTVLQECNYALSRINR